MAYWADLLMEDHQTAEKVFAVCDKAFAGGVDPSPALIEGVVRFFVEYLDGCHNRKEEEHLFPLLERLGIPRGGGPLAVMLMEHERSKELLAELQVAAASYVAGDRSVLTKLRLALGQYTSLLKQHFWKENDILYPMARRVMTEEHGEAVIAGIEAVEAELGADTRERYYRLADELAAEIPDLSLGLDPKVLAAILNHLPIELSFIGADDTVKYFSHEDGEKIFPRLRSAVGMDVRSCHPPKSLHMVEAILADFKAGTRDVAEFWLDFAETKVHVRYWAVKSPQGAYLGTLETVQDIGAIQALTGEKRLMDAG